MTAKEYIEKEFGTLFINNYTEQVLLDLLIDSHRRLTQWNSACYKDLQTWSRFKCFIAKIFHFYPY